MAKNDLQKQLAQLERALKQAGANTDDFARAINRAGGDTDKLLELVGKMTEALGDTENTATNLAERLKKIGEEFDSQLSALNKSKSAFRKIVDAAEKLRDDEEGITDLNKNQVKNLQRKLLVNKRALEAQKSGIDSELQSKGLTEKRRLELKSIQGTIEDESKAIENTVKKSGERLKLESKINKQMGVAGALIGGAGALMERLGMRSGIFQEAVQDAQESMRELAKASAESNSSISKAKIAATGFSRVAQGLGDALFDPTTIGMKLLDVFMKINKQSVEISRLTGQTGSGFDYLNTGASSAIDKMEVVAELSKQTGLNAQNAFSPSVIAGAADLKVEMGLAAEEAGNLAIIAQTSNTSIEDLTDSIVDTTSAFNSANRSAVSQGQILRDVGNVSDGIRASFAGNTQELVKGASAARRLGMDIKRLDDIAGSLLDFESSISNQLEAQLLTGKQLNLGKARELALSNDLAGLGEELFSNAAKLTEFSSMNRIQQEAYAKALGMSRDELARVAYQKALEAGMTQQQAAAAAKVNAEDMKRLDIQENLMKAVEKIAAAVTPILDFIGDILSLPLAPYFLLAAAAATKLGGGVGKAVKGIYNFGKGILKAVKNFDILNAKQKLFGKMYKGGQFMPGGGRAKAGGERAGGLFSKVLGKSDTGKDKLTDTGNKVSDVAKKTKNTPTGKNIRKFLQNISTGLKSLGDPKVLFGALNLIPASAGFIAMIPGAIGMAAIAALGKPTAMGLKALGKGLTSFGLAMMGPGGVGLLAFVGAAIGLGAAFALVGAGAMMFGKGIEFAANGVVKIFNGLTGLISSIPQLYLLGGALMSIAAGLGAIAFAGISAIPALAALSGLALISAPLVALGGMFDSGADGGDNSEMITLLKEIRDEVKKGGDVLLDGNKVGEALVLGSYISS